MIETASVCYGCEKNPLLTSFSEVKQHVHNAFLVRYPEDNDPKVSIIIKFELET